jgi:hypothetical protein
MFEIAVASASDAWRMADWAADEGWNPGNTDMQAFFATDPGGFLIGRLDGEPIACISVVKYGESFGFLGFYIVRPPWRGKGHGFGIWQAGMARLQGRNVGLDGVVVQQANYRKSGFRLAWNNVRHVGPAPAMASVPPGVTLRDAAAIPFDGLSTYDRCFFPETRDSFLAAWISLPERAALVAIKDGDLAGFGVIRRSKAAAKIGPLYAASPAIAAALVGALAARIAASEVALDTPEINKQATALAANLGLKPSFETARMYTGPDPAIDQAGLFSVASFELG